MNFRTEAYNTILRVLRGGEFSDTLLNQRANKLKNNKEDLGLYYATVKGVIKKKQKLEYILSFYTDPDKYQDTDIKIKTLLYIGMYQLIYLDSIPPHAAVHETVELAKKTLSPAVGDFINAVMREYQREDRVVYPEDPAARIANEHSYPVELIKTWIELWGEEDTEYMAMHFNESPELHIRVNSVATTATKLENYFKRREIEIVPCEGSKMMFHTHQGAAVLDEVAFSEGYFTVQDTSAAMVVELLDPQKEQSVLDLFAAPGGKCTYISEIMQNTGEVVAVDKSPRKMKLLKQAADRLQLNNIILVTTDALRYGPIAPAFDRVLVDAPCSGWGVFSRKADLRWQNHSDIEELVKLQTRALDYAANFVKPGGYMVYSTCTMNPDENEEQVKAFLSRNNKFTLEPAEKYIPKKYTEAGYLKTIPFKHFMDGAFAAKLLKST